MFVFADCSERLDFMCWHSITEASATHRKLSSGMIKYMSINNKIERNEESSTCDYGYLLLSLASL